MLARGREYAIGGETAICSDAVPSSLSAAICILNNAQQGNRSALYPNWPSLLMISTHSKTIAAWHMRPCIPSSVEYVFAAILTMLYPKINISTVSWKFAV
jgi:hypothetical protein